MAKPLTPKSISGLGVYGVVRNSEIDDILIPDGAVTGAKNFHFDRVGVSTGRPGLTTLGGTIIYDAVVEMPCLGLHNPLNGTAVAVFTEAGSSMIYEYNGTSWGIAPGMTGISGSADVSVRFVDFANRTIMLNYGTATNQYSSLRIYNGSNWDTFSGNPINAQWEDDVTAGTAQPQAQYGEVYKSRIYLAGGDTTESNLMKSRLIFSNVINSAGNVLWTPTEDFVDINPGDGEDITALKRFSLELLVFKPNHLYRFTTSGVDPDPIIKVGTRSQESIVEGKSGVYFHNDNGIYRYSGSPYATEISRPINDFIKAIPYSKYSSIVGWKDGDSLYWSVGDLTIPAVKENISWTNVVLRYSESSQIWTIYSYANEIRRGMTFFSGSASTVVVGTDHGVVAEFNKGTTDFGEPINYWIRTKWYELEGIAYSKVINDLVAVCEKAQGITLMYQIDDDSTRWYTLGQMTQLRNLFKNNNIRFYRIRFQATGANRKEASVFRSIEIVRGLLEGLITE